MEIANESVLVNNVGDANHPSTVALWDAALTAGARVWGVATDDAHHYDDAGERLIEGERVLGGDRGWVMVRAAPEATAIRAALVRGDFYSSTGVWLAREEPFGSRWLLELAAESPGEHTFRLVGERGEVLVEVRGRAAELDLSAFSSHYLRVEVHDGAGHAAWTQPIWPGESP